jgi:pimeloyl-ACP methyl ester carboxylesterase
MTPVLLLLPGMLNDARVWAPVRAALGDAAEVRVAETTLDATIPEIAARASAQLADVSPERRLVIAGFSMGGYIAFEMLRATARRVDALALIDTSARADTDEGKANREKAIAAIERDHAKFIDGLAKFTTHPNFQADAAAFGAMRTMMREAGAATAIRQNRAVMARRDQRDFARTLTMPTRVLVGADDRVTPPELAEELAGLIPGAVLERLPDCGHMAPLEQAQRVADVLRTLLQ